MCEYDSEQKTKIKKQKKMKAKCVVLQMSTSNKIYKKSFFLPKYISKRFKIKGIQKTWYRFQPYAEPEAQ